MQSGVFVELRMFRQNQVQLRDFVRKMDSDSILRKSGIFCQIWQTLQQALLWLVPSISYREKETKRENERGGKKESKNFGVERMDSVVLVYIMYHRIQAR